MDKYQCQGALEVLWEEYYCEESKFRSPFNFRSALDTVTECVKKQVPQKVIYKMGCHGGVLCPICRTMFERDWSNWKSPFCQHCGQALDWEEVK